MMSQVNRARSRLVKQLKTSAEAQPLRVQNSPAGLEGGARARVPVWVEGAPRPSDLRCQLQAVAGWLDLSDPHIKHWNADVNLPPWLVHFPPGLAHVTICRRLEGTYDWARVSEHHALEWLVQYAQGSDALAPLLKGHGPRNSPDVLLEQLYAALPLTKSDAVY